MKNVLLPIISLLAGIIIGAFLMDIVEDYKTDHSLCAKAIELKAEESDSLRTELEDCKAVYIELNNGEKLKVIKP